jgi:citrate synthase
MLSRTSFVNGLEGVVVAETRLSDVDGAAGRLILCGDLLGDFVFRHSFESAAARFWATARDEEALAPERVRTALGICRMTAFEHVSALLPALARLSASDGLRFALASLPGGGGEAHVSVTASIPVFLACIARQATGRPPVPPDPDAHHVEDFLRMLTGEPAEPREADALSTYLLTTIDHGMNASTFTARVIASTDADLVAAVVGAYGALTGPLHGGAPEPVLRMLDAIGTPDRATAWIEAQLQQGRRIMGFGHRIYRVRDPRADVLKDALESLAPGGDRLELARTVESAALDALARHKPGRKLETNVEFYTAMLLEALGIPGPAFTPVFAMGRVVGWTAHALEQRRSGRLIRPASVYVGAMP